MGTESEKIAAHIAEERNALGRNLDQLEARIHEEPKRLMHENAGAIAAGIFGAALLIGYNLVPARRRS